ncbi:MAG: M48 family metalloprotease [Ruminococcus sp.]|nr:M48 family metalloprotease [Ruminococcus sp.]
MVDNFYLLLDDRHPLGKFVMLVHFLFELFYAVIRKLGTYKDASERPGKRSQKRNKSDQYFRIVMKLLCFIRDLIVSVPALIWSAITVLLTRPSSRDMEYDADKFTFNAGYGNGLCSFLHYVQTTYFNKHQGIIDKISSTHPSPENRVNKLQEMGAKY